jgi:hypothetical protein
MHCCTSAAALVLLAAAHLIDPSASFKCHRPVRHHTAALLIIFASLRLQSYYLVSQ